MLTSCGPSSGPSVVLPSPLAFRYAPVPPRSRRCSSCLRCEYARDRELTVGELDGGGAVEPERRRIDNDSSTGGGSDLLVRGAHREQPIGEHVEIAQAEPRGSDVDEIDYGRGSADQVDDLRRAG